MKQEKNGFTLIELLAVIVVLAVLILFAMPTITGQTEKAKRRIFAQEAGEIITIAEQAYQDLSASGSNSLKICVPIRGLVANGDLKKNVGNLKEGEEVNTSAYQGSVLIDVSDTIAKYHIWLENGSYKIDGDGTGFSTQNVKAIDPVGSYTGGINACNGNGSVPAVYQKDVNYTTDSNGKTNVEVKKCTWSTTGNTCS